MGERIKPDSVIGMGRNMQLARWGRGAGLGTAKVGEALPVYFKTCGLRETAFADALRQYPLPAQNAL